MNPLIVFVSLIILSFYFEIVSSLFCTFTDKIKYKNSILSAASQMLSCGVWSETNLLFPMFSSELHLVELNLQD